jgi:hypothetical protein
MALSRQEFIELGVSLPEEPLLDWAKEQLENAKRREARLLARGLTGDYLSGLRALLASIETRLSESAETPAPCSSPAERALRLEARRYWKEAQDLARVGFGTRPDELAEFRRGVLTGLLIKNLMREVEIVVGLLRRHAGVLAPLGADEAFLAQGTALVDRLKSAASALETATAVMAASTAQLCHDKGVLYDLTRTLVRLGRLEFRADPDAASAFSFAELNRARKQTGPGGRE